jgi:hypothetical protein
VDAGCNGRGSASPKSQVASGAGPLSGRSWLVQVPRGGLEVGGSRSRRCWSSRLRHWGTSQSHEGATLTQRVLTVLAYERSSRGLKRNAVKDDIALFSCVLDGSWSVVRGRTGWNLGGTGRRLVVWVNVDVSCRGRLM